MLNIGRPPFLLLLLSSFFLFRHAITSHDIPLSLSLSPPRICTIFILSSLFSLRTREGGKTRGKRNGKKKVYIHCDIDTIDR